jgi:hypothetical protein
VFALLLVLILLIIDLSPIMEFAGFFRMAWITSHGLFQLAIVFGFMWANSQKNKTTKVIFDGEKGHGTRSSCQQDNFH